MARSICTLAAAVWCLLLGGLTMVRGTPLSCAATDIAAALTPCNTTSNTMLAVRYLPPTCTKLVPLGFSVPEPQPLACDIACSSGEFLDVLHATCARCPVGSSSNSGGRLIRDFSAMPDDFVTYCEPKPCAKWASTDDGGMLMSGDQTGLRHADPYTKTPPDQTVASSLVTIVPVINWKHGGKFMFSYRVESERYYDGLRVFLNGTEYRDPAEQGTNDYRSTFLQSGVHTSWSRLEVPLPFGANEVRLVFSKDSNQASLSAPALAGQDRAFVRDIVVEGVQWWSPDCPRCAPGTESTSDRMHCQPCPADYTSSDEHPECRACPVDTWSAPGAAACTPKRPCKIDDYIAVYGPCEAATTTRLRTWQLAPSTKCTMRGGSEPPGSERVACEACMPGFVRRIHDGTSHCAACKPGDALVGGIMCQQCQKGQAALQAVQFSDFGILGAELSTSLFFSTQCRGECAGCSTGGTCVTEGKGFELYPMKDVWGTGANAPQEGDDNTRTVIRSSPNNGGTYTSVLHYETLSAGAASLSMRYYFEHTASGRVVSSALTAVVRVDGAILASLSAQASRTSPWSLELSLRDEAASANTTAGPLVIEVEVSQTADRAPLDEVTLVVLEWGVVGDQLKGSASSCTTCQAGTYCPSHQPVYAKAPSVAVFPCPPGTYTPFAGLQECQRCPDGQYASGYGNAKCLPCPLGSTPSADRSRCDASCVVGFGNRTYDLSPLEKHFFGPVPAIASDPSAGSFLINFCTFVNHNGSSSFCESRHGMPLQSSYACERFDADRSYSLGTLPEWSVSANGGLTFGLSRGDVCAKTDDVTIRRSASISMTCDIDLHAHGVLEFTGENPACQFNFNFRSHHACPACREEDYELVSSACTADGQMQKSSRLKAGAPPCWGGSLPVAPFWTRCDVCQPEDYLQAWSECDQGRKHRVYQRIDEDSDCRDDGSAILNLTETARAAKLYNVTCYTLDAEIGMNPFTVALVVVAFIVLTLGVLIIVVHTRYTKLRTQYSSLSDANANNTGQEMDMRPLPNGRFDLAEQQQQHHQRSDFNTTNGNGLGPMAKGKSVAEADSESSDNEPNPAVRTE